MRPGTRILFSLYRRIAVLAAQSAAEETGNQPKDPRDINAGALGWFFARKSRRVKDRVEGASAIYADGHVEGSGRLTIADPRRRHR
jgi:hypothetical protein